MTAERDRAWRDELLTTLAASFATGQRELGSLTAAQASAAVGLAVRFAREKVAEAVTELTVVA